MTKKLEDLQRQLKQADRKSKKASGNTAALKELSTILTQIKLMLEVNKVELSVKLLESLRYNSIYARQSEVKDEHAETFRWILERDQTRTCDSPRFMEWLDSQGGLYWVSGKAGSGKSTLMKYLWHHTSTRSALRNWAGSRKLVTASHFFWNAGSNVMQMSQIGLLRSLLFQILRQCPELISCVCQSKYDLGQSIPDFQWTLKELLQAFEQLSHQKINSVMICLFIDGLDEYNGSYPDIIQLFQKFSMAKNIKICLSSRPWNVFQNAFGGGQYLKLKLEDLTKHDIQLYVNDNLAKDYRFKALADADQRYQELIEEVVTKAQGVFLWVVLVVESLLNGLTDDNSIPDMQKRLQSLPSDLEKFFQHMMDGIEEFYKPQTAQIFEMVTVARSALPVFLLKYLDEERDNPDYALTAKRKAPSDAEIKQLSEKSAKYLNARCKGLLAIYYEKNKTFSFGYKIEFLHRTVKDFLMSPDVKTLMRSRAPRNFHAGTTLCRAYLALLKELLPSEIDMYKYNPDDLDGVTRDIMYYAKLAEMEREKSESALLDELDRFHAVVLRQSGVTSARTNEDLGDWEEVVQESIGPTFLEWAVEAGLVIYVEKKLREDPSLILDELPRPLLSHALQQGKWHYRREMLAHALPQEKHLKIDNLDPEMIRVLLSFGADPNQKMPGNQRLTVWSSFVTECKDTLESMSEIMRYHVFSAARMLIESGANPGLICTVGDSAWGKSGGLHLLPPWSNLSKTQCTALERALAVEGPYQATPFLSIISTALKKRSGEIWRV